MYAAKYLTNMWKAIKHQWKEKNLIMKYYLPTEKNWQSLRADISQNKYYEGWIKYEKGQLH